MSSVPEPKNVIYGLFDKSLPGREIRYVGQTSKGARARLGSHATACRRYPTRFPVYRWMSKHGIDNIGYVILEVCATRGELNDAEARWIADYRARIGRRLLNVRPGGSQSPLAEESKKKIGDKARGRHASAETRAKMSAAAKAAHKRVGQYRQRSWTSEQRREWSKKMSGEHNGFYGRKHTAESLRLMVEHRPRMTGPNNPFYGKTHSPEAMAKIIAANVGRQQSDHERLGKSLASRGEGNPATNLTDAQVTEIYHRYAAGGITQTALGELYGVSQVVVSHIVRGDTWTYLGFAPIRSNCGRKPRQSNLSVPCESR